MNKQNYCKNANDSIKEGPCSFGGYCYFNWYPMNAQATVELDGEFNLEDLKRLADLLQHIKEESLK